MANISTPINSDLLLIQDKRFKHLAQSFIDPRSPSEGIVRTPIVLKSTDISSIVNTPRILEEELDEEDDFQKTFEEALSKLSFEDCLSNGQRTPQAKLSIIETHFDCVPEEMDALKPIAPLKPMSFANVVKQSLLDPRSPTVGIDRTPLAFDKPDRIVPALVVPIELNLMGHEDVVVEERRHESVEDIDAREDEEEAKEGAAEKINDGKKKQPERDVAEKSEVFIDQVIFGTPVNVAGNQPIQQVRTPLSCLANRRRVDLNSQRVVKSPLSQLKPVKAPIESCTEPAKAKKKSTANPFETAPRKLIR